MTIVFALASLNLLTLSIVQTCLSLHSLNRRFPCILCILQKDNLLIC